jgi:hypothetical protein
VPDATARAWAAQTGIGSSQFDALIEIANTGPGVGPLYEAWRRRELTDAQFRTGLKRMALEDQWVPALMALRDHLLTPDVVANAVQQGFLPGGGVLAGDVTGALPLTIPAEQVAIDPVLEAAGSGVNEPHLRVLAQLAGNPPGPMELLQLWNRGVITEQSVEHGIREGRTKTKWTSAIKELRHFILSPAEAAGLRLRGWITPQQSYDLGALHGASPETMDRLFLNRGRPATTHQVFIGLRRGGSYDGPTAAIDPAFVRAVEQSDIRPEWTNLLWAQRYSYPSAFVLRGLTQAGDLTAGQTEQILLYEGWEPTLAADVSAKWAEQQGSGSRELTKAELSDEYEGGYITLAELQAGLTALGYSGTALDREVHLADARRVKRWREKAVDAIGKAYIGHDLTDAEAIADLAEAGVTGDAATLLMRYLQLARRVATKELTPAQIKRAYKKSLITQADARQRLIDEGYDPVDADVFLAS